MPWLRKLRSAACLRRRTSCWGGRGEVLEQRIVEIAQLVFGGEHLIEGMVELVVLQRFELTGAKR